MRVSCRACISLGIRDMYGGSFGRPALALLHDLGRVTGGQLPATLADDSSWAAFEFAPYARMRLSLALRRALAMSLRDVACSDAEAEALRGSGAPPSDPSRTFDGELGEPVADEAAGSGSGPDDDGDV